MIEVYVSHLGETPLVGIHEPLSVVTPSTLRSVLNQIEAEYPGFCECVLDQTGEQLSSSTMAFRHVEIDADGRILEGENTTPLTRLEEVISEEDENLLIALFHPEQLVGFLLETLVDMETRFEYADGSVGYRAFISNPGQSQGGQPLFAQAEPERLYPFTSGRLISELMTATSIDVGQDKLIPIALRNAIAELWGLDEDFRLRLFQEEALVHIIGELAQTDDTARCPLLLSIPTGGGKTEAFLIPLIAHLHDQRGCQLNNDTIPQETVK